MPELPDIAAYIGAMETRIVGQPIEQIRLASPFLLRTVEPPLTEAEGRPVRQLRRIGKRIAIGVEGELWLVLHLMIAGRLHWRTRGATLRGRQSLAAFDFPDGSLVVTEAGSKRRASLSLVQGEEALQSEDGIRYSGFVDLSKCLGLETRERSRLPARSAIPSHGLPIPV